MTVLYREYRKWPSDLYRGEDGVLVGADAAQEWLLPWWWKHYTLHNSHPVSWVDLGLSPSMRDWCKDRGELLVLRIADIFVASREEIAPQYASQWEEQFGITFWQCRNAWFKKPAALLQTPYERTLWIDVDCEIRGSLTPLFALCDPPISISMRIDRYSTSAGDPIYNSGVISNRRGLPLMENWAELAFDCNAQFMGDQDILSHIIAKEKVSVRPLPSIYHRFRSEEEEGAIIIHWTGPHGKQAIQHKLIQEHLENHICRENFILPGK